MKGVVTIDMWYGDPITKCDNIDCYFNDSDCTYSGNLYIDGKAVGDYTSKDSCAIEKKFAFLGFKFKD